MYLLFIYSSWLVIPCALLSHSPGTSHNIHSYANNIKIADIPLSCLAIFFAGSSQCWNKRDKKINDSKRCSGTSFLVYLFILFLNIKKISSYFMYLLRSHVPVPHNVTMPDPTCAVTAAMTWVKRTSVPAVGLTPACCYDQARSTGRTYEHRHRWLSGRRRNGVPNHGWSTFQHHTALVRQYSLQ
jgi:hypothetical protein